IAALDTNMRKLFRNKHRKFVLAFFAAGRTENSAERPIMRAKCAAQESSAAIAFGLEHAKQGKGIALGTNVRRSFHHRLGNRLADKFRVGLQKSASKKFFQRAALTFGLRNGASIREAAFRPILAKELHPCRRTFLREFGRRFRKWLRRVRLHEREKIRIFWKQNDEIQIRTEFTARRNDRLVAPFLGDICQKLFLELRYLRVELQRSRGKGIFLSQSFSQLDSFFIVGRFLA